MYFLMVLLCSFLLPWSLAANGFPGPLEVDAHVQLLHKRVQRQRRSLVDPEYDINYHLTVTAGGITHELHLKPAGVIFSPSFRSHEIRTEPDGRVSWSNVTPNLKRLAEIEYNLYTDKSKNTVVHVEEDADGRVWLNGVVNDARIRRIKRGTDGGTKHVIVTNIPPGAHEAKPTPPPKVIEVQMGPANASHDEWVLPFEPALEGRAEGAEPLTVRPELAVVIEYNLGKQIEEAGLDPIEYTAIMFNSANAKYALTPDPVIIATLVGVHIMKDEASQPFVSEAKTVSDADGDKYNLSAILLGYSAWAHENLELLGTADVSPLQLGVQFDELGLLGLAAAPGACRHNLDGSGLNVATPCSGDRGAYFYGAFTTAHELAHSLGAVHDGEPGAEECPFNDGYLMSYRGFGTLNHFKLSPCSLHLIDNYARSPGAACLHEFSGKVPLPQAATYAQQGDRVGAKEICDKHMPGWVPIPQNPDESCRNTFCAPPSRPVTQIAKTNYPPGNGASCGMKGLGQCMNGWCVGQGPLPSLNERCAELLQNESAKFLQPNEDFDVCTPGAPLVCEYQIAGEMEYDTIPFAIKSGVKCNADPQVAVTRKIYPFDGVCFKGRCMRVEEIGDPNKECVLATAKDEARLVNRSSISANGCKGSVRCVYGTEGEDLVPGNDGVVCKDNGGKAGMCADGACVTETGMHPLPHVPHPPGAHPPSPTLQEICQELLGSRDARPVGQKDRNAYCSRLNCEVRERNGKRLATSQNQTPDGTICGPLRRCKNGTCVVCGL